jgi:molecular chaperone DnaJ
MKFDKNKNYYKTLGVNNNDDFKTIKKSYYKLSFKYHPDKGGDEKVFSEISEAYKVLSNEELRNEYDNKSKYGSNYNEFTELFDISFDFDYETDKENLEKFKKSINNIQIIVGNDFDGKVSYERYIRCKDCDGSGNDLSSKIVIRDNDGNITKVFDADDGCDFCEGTGKNYDGKDCGFCQGNGKIGINPCKTCNGEGRILGRQKLKGLKLKNGMLKKNSLGHYSKNGTGYLLIKLEEE